MGVRLLSVTFRYPCSYACLKLGGTLRTSLDKCSGSFRILPNKKGYKALKRFSNRSFGKNTVRKCYYTKSSEYSVCRDSPVKIYSLYPPAMAPTIMKGSAPVATALGSGTSGSWWDRSSPQAKNRTNARRFCVT
jgi:hypothetical protein